MFRLFNWRAVLTILAVLVVLGSASYAYNMRADLIEYRQRLQMQEQREKALQDSLRQLKTYADSLGNERRLYGRVDMPEFGTDRLGTDRLGNAFDRSTRISLAPETASETGAVEEIGIGEGRMFVLNERIGRYTVTGELFVPPTGPLTYDLNVTGDPIELRTYRVEVDGVQETRLDIGSGVQLQGMQTSYVAPEPTDPGGWELLAPVIQAQPGRDDLLTYGAGIRRDFDLFYGLSGEFAAEATFAQSGRVYPTGRFSLNW